MCNAHLRWRKFILQDRMQFVRIPPVQTCRYKRHRRKEAGREGGNKRTDNPHVRECSSCHWWENSIEAERRSKDRMAAAARFIAPQEAGQTLPSHRCHRTDRWTRGYALQVPHRQEGDPSFFPDPAGTRCTLVDALRPSTRGTRSGFFCVPHSDRVVHRVGLCLSSLLWARTALLWSTCVERRPRRLHFGNLPEEETEADLPPGALRNVERANDLGSLPIGSGQDRAESFEWVEI